MAEALICTQNWLRAPSFSQPEGQNTQEELETSERIVRGIEIYFKSVIKFSVLIFWNLI
jgi:hypothetical protein